MPYHQTTQSPCLLERAKSIARSADNDFALILVAEDLAMLASLCPPERRVMAKEISDDFAASIRS
ncbi:hypothetical protein Q0Z83_056660 [Actinoplanes sichuanensis]|nr:hypothetical protein [Actinoplanes sichuanensis]BEL07475.1 hypothetical protein Q0Z83_056660 [Actinoplanes sichuanensis]